MFIKPFKSTMSLLCLTYFPNRTKNFMRMQRAGSSWVNKLPDPAKPVILSNTKNKIQLNAMLIERLLNSEYNTNAMQKHTLMIAGVSDLLR